MWVLASNGEALAQEAILDVLWHVDLDWYIYYTATYSAPEDSLIPICNRK